MGYCHENYDFSIHYYCPALLISQKVSNMVIPEVLKTLYSSMAPRIQAMVDTSSGPTNYKKNFSIILDVFHQ